MCAVSMLSISNPFNPRPSPHLHLLSHSKPCDLGRAGKSVGATYHIAVGGEVVAAHFLLEPLQVLSRPLAIPHLSRKLA